MSINVNSLLPGSVARANGLEFEIIDAATFYQAQLGDYILADTRSLIDSDTLPSSQDIEFGQFGDSGNKFFGYGNAALHEYTVSTAYDVTAIAGSPTNSTSTFSADTVRFKPDGTRFYSVNASVVSSQLLGAAWDVSTAVSSGVSFSFVAQSSNIGEIGFSSDGLKMYGFDTNNGRVYEYDLSTAWAENTATYVGYFFDSAGFSGFVLNPSDDTFYVADLPGGRVLEYSLSTPKLMNTVSLANTFLIPKDVLNPVNPIVGWDLDIPPDESKLIIIGSANQDPSIETIISANFSTIDNTKYLATGVLTIKCPVPTLGRIFVIRDAYGTFPKFPVVLQRNSTEPIEGIVDDFTLTAGNQEYRFIYSGATKGWIKL